MEIQSKKKNNQRQKIRNQHVIPGFGLTIGVTITMLSLIVMIPIASIVVHTAKMGAAEFLQVVTTRQVINAFRVSLSCSLIAALINVIFGVIIAWVLVRYEFPLKRFFDGLIELPFALPTAVAGITLTSLYCDTGFLGRMLLKVGIKVAYTRLGIILAMIFVGIPFVIRAVQPVLEKLDDQYEEAAAMLGANQRSIFWKVILPEIKSPLLTGFGLALARGIGEYGSVVFIAGNIPNKTQIVPLLIMSKLEQYDYEGATAIALIMLLISFVILLAINLIQAYQNRKIR